MNTLRLLGLILLIIFVLGFVIIQVYAIISSNDAESHDNMVLKKYDNFEIRLYEEAIFSYVTVPYNSYKNGTGKGFQILAGYIFGGNEKSEKIAMTTPVEIEMSDSMTMKFMVPKKYKIDELPKPNNSKIAFKEEPKKLLAVISFGGFADDTKIEKHIDELKQELEINDIKHNKKFSFLGYNPPYQLFMRKNEIVVEIENDSLKRHINFSK